jgi:type II secretory pathway component PulF
MLIVLDWVVFLLAVLSPVILILLIMSGLAPLAAIVVILLGVYFVIRGAYAAANIILSGGQIFASRRERRLAEIYTFLSRALRAGRSPTEAVEQLTGETRGLGFDAALRRTLQKLRANSKLADALSSAPRTFPPPDVAVVHAGEQSGRLTEALDFLATGKRGRASFGVSAALAAFHIFVAVLVVLIMFAMVLPRFKEIYDQLGGELPWLTQVLMDTSYRFMNSPVIALGVVGILVIAVYALFDRRSGLLSFFLWLFPYLRRVYWSEPFARFSFVMGSLLQSGAEFSSAVALAVRASGSGILRGRERRLTGVKDPQELGAELARLPELPADYSTEYVRVGDPDLPGRLLAASRLHVREYDAIYSHRWAVVVPLVILVVGVFMFVVVIALYLPMFHIPKLVGRS